MNYSIKKTAAPSIRNGLTLIVLAITLGLFAVAMNADEKAKPSATKKEADSSKAAASDKEKAGANAFLDAYKVFMHPRCMNCHPDGDVPLQGDDSHPHSQNVKRGPDGKGLYALKCANCHQDANTPGENMPPGNPNWHLLPPQMPMVFQGRTPAQLAKQMKDPAQNGGKSLEQLFHHVSEDSLVLWGWNPGEGRTKPPMSHEEFAKKMKEWIDAGAPIPE